MLQTVQTELCLGSITVLLQYGALAARAPALLSLSLEPQRCSQNPHFDPHFGGAGGLGRGWGLELRRFQLV